MKFLHSIGFRILLVGGLSMVLLVLILFITYATNTHHHTISMEVRAARNLVMMAEAIRHDMAAKWAQGIFSNEGRGFAVVADEVRTLAQRTQQSTAEIQQMIERLQAGAGEAVEAMRTGHSQAQESVNRAAAAGDALAAIREVMRTITDMSARIASAAEQQGSVTEEMSRNVTAISNASGETAEEARKTAAASEQLAVVALRLQEAVERFRI